MFKKYLQHIIAKDMTKRYLGTKRDHTFQWYPSGKVYTIPGLFYYINLLYIKLYGQDYDFFTPPDKVKAKPIPKAVTPLVTPAPEIKNPCKNCGLKDFETECKRCGYPDKDKMLLWELKALRSAINNMALKR